MKTDANFFKLWGGIAGIQSTLPVLLSHTPRLPLPTIAALTSTHIAQRFRIQNKGLLAPGYDADLALLDLHTTCELTPDMLHDRHKLSPYVGRTFHAQVVRTLLRGHTIFHENTPRKGPAPRLLHPT